MNAPPNFNRLAHLYRWMEFITFGPFLWHCRCTLLHSLAGRRRALILGDGDGRFTARLLRENPYIQIDAVDASPAMLAALLRRAGPNAMRVRAHCGDVRSFNPPNLPYDLIVTHFFLDCLTTAEVQSLAATLHTAAAPHALWLISEFAVPSTAYGRLVANPLISFLYWTFRQLTGLYVRSLPDHRTALGNAGFVLKEHHPQLSGLLVSELWTATSN